MKCKSFTLPIRFSFANKNTHKRCGSVQKSLKTWCSKDQGTHAKPLNKSCEQNYQPDNVCILPFPFLTHLLGNASPQLPLQALINHELDSGVQHQQQGREGPVPQRCDALVTDDLHKCICKIKTIWKQTRERENL